ncbi:MAG TPA: cytochrome b/b6 domain-containing protein [Gaiellaceae bacterium]|jgi:formate dehydrogenase subunit gamma
MAPERRRLPRFGRTLRLVHWVHATAFLILLGSGLCLYLPTLAEAVNRRPLLKAIHIYTAVAWLVALVLVVCFGDRRELGRAVREIDRFDADDRAWLRGRAAPQGWLNAGQKLNAIVTAAFAILFAISGFFLWYGERDTRFRLANALLVHDWLMYASFFLFIGHLYLSLVYPRTRHALSGMTRGWVDEDWALRHHRKWVESVREDVLVAARPGTTLPWPAATRHCGDDIEASSDLR